MECERTTINDSQLLSILHLNTEVNLDSQIKEDMVEGKSLLAGSEKFSGRNVEVTISTSNEKRKEEEGSYQESSRSEKIKGTKLRTKVTSNGLGEENKIANDKQPIHNEKDMKHNQNDVLIVEVTDEGSSAKESEECYQPIVSEVEEIIEVEMKKSFNISAEMSQISVVKEECVSEVWLQKFEYFIFILINLCSNSFEKEYFPSGTRDVNHQQIDLRKKNSWSLKLHEISTTEVIN
jgi:hypothetical protein